MRTTIVLKDEIYERAKRRAVRLRITLSELVNRALRQELEGGARPPEPGFAMVTYGPEAPRSHHEPADFAAALEAEDLAAVEEG